jgi:hypothetical protein
MKKTALVLVPFFAIATGCASKDKVDTDMLEKYRHCYHQNEKIVNACIKKNENGEYVTAMQLENAAFPGQYK